MPPLLHHAVVRVALAAGFLLRHGLGADVGGGRSAEGAEPQGGVLPRVAASVVLGTDHDLLAIANPLPVVTLDNFASLCNQEMVDLETPDHDDFQILRSMIVEHFDATKSAVARFILNDWDNQWQHFIKVFPRDYKKVLQAQKQTATANK